MVYQNMKKELPFVKNEQKKESKQNTLQLFLKKHIDFISFLLAYEIIAFFILFNIETILAVILYQHEKY